MKNKLLLVICLTSALGGYGQNSTFTDLPKEKQHAFIKALDYFDLKIIDISKITITKKEDNIKEQTSINLANNTNIPFKNSLTLKYSNVLGFTSRKTAVVPKL